MVTALFIFKDRIYTLKFMDQSLLQQFRQQLASWIEARLESQRLPFQRLELCPRTLTDQGRLVPDLVLWINRDSQLAGSMILLPDAVDDQVLAEGVSLSRALGLGHFSTWAAREVSIWNVVSGEPCLLHSFSLPPANQITPEHFQQTLDDLLDRLKVVTVTSAPPSEEYSGHYFANLCLRNLQELAPDLMISTRLAAGQSAADEWVEHAPREKAWMSLWRVLFLLWQRRLPPGLQPERLELAIHYALTELTKGQLSWLDIQKSEPPLPEEVAIRLHHLASRLKQLGWPHNDKHAEDLICLLLDESAHRFGLESPCLPWPVDEVTLWVNCQPPQSSDDCSLITSRAFLAGWAFKTSLQKRTTDNNLAESLQTFDAMKHLPSAVAVLRETQPLDRKERDARLILLRQVWPSRRFDLPRNAPAWLWDALHLAGLISEDLSLTLPQDWYRVPGILSLWTILTERYQVAEISNNETGVQSLHFVQATKKITSVKVHRNGQTIEVPYELLAVQMPGTTQIWLKADEEVVTLLRNHRVTALGNHWPDWPESLTWGVFIFLRTHLGRYLWGLCSDQSSLPEFNEVIDAVLAVGMPIPDEIIISDLSLTGSPEALTVPETKLLEREFTGIFGSVPDLPEEPVSIVVDTPRTRRRSSAPLEQIKAKVFLDGIPRFPDHYLMHIYRPTLTHYELCGPLEIVEEFFDNISLGTNDQEHTIEVSGKIVAEALILASYTGEKRVSLPEDERLLEEMVLNYRNDLKRLWDNLIRECRRFEPHRQLAIKLARRIWKQQGLPPESVVKVS